MIDALVHEIATEAQVPSSVVKKVLRVLPQVALQRALEGKKTNIPGFVTVYPDRGTLKATVSAHLKAKYRSNKG